VSFPNVTEIELSSQGSTRLLTVTGEIDMSSVDKVRAAVDAAFAERPETVVLDISQIEFCDSSGIHLVVSSHRRAQQCRVRFVTVRPVGPAWRAFELCGIDQEVQFVTSPDGAATSSA
jgi:anti-sigma B factor antagonist